MLLSSNQRARRSLRGDLQYIPRYSVVRVLSEVQCRLRTSRVHFALARSQPYPQASSTLLANLAALHLSKPEHKLSAAVRDYQNYK